MTNPTHAALERMAQNIFDLMNAHQKAGVPLAAIAPILIAEHALAALESFAKERGLKLLSAEASEAICMAIHDLRSNPTTGMPTQGVANDEIWTAAHAAAPSFPWDGGQSEEGEDGR